jgi:Zn-dependent protease
MVLLLYMQEVTMLSEGVFPILVVIFSIILHEIAHGYAAYIQGDLTAYRQGRLTLNPVSHVDPIGSVLVPFIAFVTAGTFFGWAKPVPYNVHVIKTKLGEAFVAAAGVLTNLFIAFVAGLAFLAFSSQGELSLSFAKALFTILSVNLSLAFFNLIPVPPFDGMSILQALFPRLKIKSPLVYNPLYMVGAILIASVLYGFIMPPLLEGVLVLIS